MSLKSFEFEETLFKEKVEVSYQPAPLGMRPGGIFTLRGVSTERAHDLCHCLWPICPICGVDTRPPFLQAIAPMPAVAPFDIVQVADALAARAPVPKLLTEQLPARFEGGPLHNPESRGRCAACGQELRAENSSKLQSGEIRHIGCPKIEPRDPPKPEPKTPAKTNKNASNSQAKGEAKGQGQAASADAQFADLVGDPRGVKKQVAEDNRRAIHEDFGLRPEAIQKQAVDKASAAVADMAAAALPTSEGARQLIHAIVVGEVDPSNPPCTGDSATCTRSGGECLECGERDCPHHEALHYHHDGCPACSGEETPTDPEEIRRRAAEGVEDAAPGKRHLYVDPITLEASEFEFAETEELLAIADDGGNKLVALTPRTFASFRQTLIASQFAATRKKTKQTPAGMNSEPPSEELLAEMREKVSILEVWVTAKYTSQVVQRAVELFEPRNYRHEDAFLPLPPKKAESAAQRAQRLAAAEKAQEVAEVVKEILPQAEPTPPPQAILAPSSKVPATQIAELKKYIAEIEGHANIVIPIVAEGMPVKAGSSVAVAGLVLGEDFFRASNFAAVILEIVKAGAKDRKQVRAACEELDRMEENGQPLCAALGRVTGGWRERLSMVIQRNCPDLPEEAS